MPCQRCKTQNTDHNGYYCPQCRDVLANRKVKTCSKCHFVKPIEKFYNSKIGFVDNKMSHCQECHDRMVRNNRIKYGWYCYQCKVRKPIDQFEKARLCRECSIEREQRIDKRRCAKCHEYFPPEQFPKGPIRIGNRCESCAVEMDTKYRRKSHYDFGLMCMADLAVFLGLPWTSVKYKIKHNKIPAPTHKFLKKLLYTVEECEQIKKTLESLNRNV